MLLLIDNYDSFTYNLYQYFAGLGQEVEVRRNDKISLAEIEELSPERLVVSPGPSTPLNAGISNQLIHHFGKQLPVLGVCLGHQCIGHTYGGQILQAREIRHGKSSEVFHTNKGIFRNLPSPFSVIRYHSLVVDPDSLPPCLKVTAWCEDGTIMGLQHSSYPVYGVQFHPESFMTSFGMELLENFLQEGVPVK